MLTTTDTTIIGKLADHISEHECQLSVNSKRELIILLSPDDRKTVDIGYLKYALDGLLGAKGYSIDSRAIAGTTSSYVIQPKGHDLAFEEKARGLIDAVEKKRAGSLSYTAKILLQLFSEEKTVDYIRYLSNPTVITGDRSSKTKKSDDSDAEFSDARIIGTGREHTKLSRDSEVAIEDVINAVQRMEKRTASGQKFLGKELSNKLDHLHAILSKDRDDIKTDIRQYEAMVQNYVSTEKEGKKKIAPKDFEPAKKVIDWLDTACLVVENFNRQVQEKIGAMDSLEMSFSELLKKSPGTESDKSRN